MKLSLGRLLEKELQRNPTLQRIRRRFFARFSQEVRIFPEFIDESICYNPLSRDKLQQFLAERRLWRNFRRPNAFHEGLLNRSFLIHMIGADCRHLRAYELIASKPFAVGHAYRTDHTDRRVGVGQSNTSTSSQSLEMERFGSCCRDQASRNSRNSNSNYAPDRGKNTWLRTDIRWRGF